MRYEEHDEQVELCRRAALRPYRGATVRYYIYAIPNAGTRGGRRAMLAGVRQKAEGLTAGVPDIECMVAIPPYTGFHLEMKRKDGVPSDVSAAQKEMMERLTSCGRKCETGYGADDAWKKLCAYLEITS